MPKTRRRFEGWLEETVGDCAALRSTPWGSAALLSSFLFLCLLLAGAASAQMDDIDRAGRMHDRLAGVPPDDATLAAMANHSS